MSPVLPSSIDSSTVASSQIGMFVRRVELARARGDRADAHQRRHHQVAERVDVARRAARAWMPAAPRLDQALDEVLELDADVLEHLQEARVGLALAPAVDAALRVDHALHRLERELRPRPRARRGASRDRLPHVDVAEGDVARLVAQHVAR